MRAREHTAAMLRFWSQAGISAVDLVLRRCEGTMIGHHNASPQQLPLAWLRAENVRHAEIYIRPARHHAWAMVLLDDVNDELALRVAQKYAALVVQTSPAGGCHLWLCLNQALDEPQRYLAQRWLIPKLNADPEINGILVQLPLPKQIDEEAVLNTIDLEKDVDGFHPVNIGRLAMKGREPLFIPCTPAGCMELLADAGVETNGAEAVIVGRSNIVGLPMAMLLQKANATVTICHSRTKDLTEHLKRADIVVAAIGWAEMIKGDMLKPGVAVIDVGINRVDDDTQERGYRLVGDVEYDSAAEVAGAITPVPGGVGPMTIAMLMKNTLRAAEIALEKR